MTEAHVYLGQIKELAATLDECISGVPPERPHQRPGPGLNPIGWNYFHLLRIWDLDLNWICKGQRPDADAWHRGGFTEHSGYDPTSKGAGVVGVGFGYSDAEVDELQVERHILQQYQTMLLTETDAYLSSAGPDEMQRQTPSQIDPTVMKSVAQRMRHIIAHSYAHIGEVRYAKGVLDIPDNEHPPAPVR